jgi:hypothetical protein
MSDMYEATPNGGVEYVAPDGEQKLSRCDYDGLSR